MKRTFSFTLCLFFAAIVFLPAYALEGMVTRLESGGNVVINRGINAQVNPETILYVTRMGRPIATIKVIQVDDYNSLCAPVEYVGSERIQLGDVFSDTPFEKQAEETQQRDPVETPARQSQQEDKSQEELQADRLKKQQEYEKTTTENFKKTVEKKTVALAFKRGSGGTIKLNLFDTYNFLSTIVFAGQYAAVNPWYAGTYAYGTYADFKSSANPERVRNVQMEITYWDSEYLDAYAAYYAFKEVVTDPRRVNIVRENIYRQKGLDKFHVFQVKLINPGPGAFQLAPFPWHFYLEGKDGARLKAEHYDEVLDKALNPGQAVNGYVYFSRFDQQGQPLLEGGGVKVLLEDILGNKRTVNFK